jgi:hypothetical protein
MPTQYYTFSACVYLFFNPTLHKPNILQLYTKCSLRVWGAMA